LDGKAWGSPAAIIKWLSARPPFTPINHWPLLSLVIYGATNNFVDIIDKRLLFLLFSVTEGRKVDWHL